MPIKGANWHNWMLIGDSEGCSMVMSLPTIPTNFGTLNFMSYFLKASSLKNGRKSAETQFGRLESFSRIPLSRTPGICLLF